MSPCWRCFSYLIIFIFCTSLPELNLTFLFSSDRVLNCLSLEVSDTALSEVSDRKVQFLNTYFKIFFLSSLSFVGDFSGHKVILIFYEPFLLAVVLRASTVPYILIQKYFCWCELLQFLCKFGFWSDWSHQSNVSFYLYFVEFPSRHPQQFL